MSIRHPLARSRPLLLIVDDDHLLKRAIERSARTAGMDVIHAMTGSEVVPTALRQRPDAILLDLILPDRDGQDVLAQLKATPELAPIPVIVFSSRTEQEARLLVLELGADSYLQKPFQSDMLIQRIVNQIEKSRAGESKRFF